MQDTEKLNVEGEIQPQDRKEVYLDKIFKKLCDPKDRVEKLSFAEVIALCWEQLRPSYTTIKKNEFFDFQDKDFLEALQKIKPKDEVNYNYLIHEKILEFNKRFDEITFMEAIYTALTNMIPDQKEFSREQLFQFTDKEFYSGLCKAFQREVELEEKTKNK
jgi:hypothetical protein